MKWFFLPDYDRDKLEAITKRLYSGKRIDADEMRDMAHKLAGVVDALIDAI